MIYAEIPEANAWLTGLGVVLGVGQFGLAGVVLGPLLASVPLICCLAVLKEGGSVKFLWLCFCGKGREGCPIDLLLGFVGYCW